MVELKSYAKINLGLEVIGKRDDGYHDLKTIFQTIDFFDILYLRENTINTIRLRGDNKHIGWWKQNTIYKAFKTIYNNYNISQGFDVSIKKNIPPGSGLGGGSSNAAVILLFLNEWFNLKISLTELIEMGIAIGADVPFFFLGGTVLGEGIGEKMTKIIDLDETGIGIVIPGISVSTRLIFSRFRLTTEQFESKIDIFLKSGNRKILENYLESITFQLFPDIKRIKDKMQTYGSELVLMSGSGSAIFCTVENCSINRIKKDFPDLVLTRTINAEYYQNSVGAWPSGKA
ncbi:MAG: 4-(cytidine 5'-diphospho)-2-C-methyl-D-erythritol kinase, partial [Candidatus Aminicenantes bacterium]|nr:4-(cytidine 5'-diphospho)-2-C-methyl-D-erythritol kinase [Candidatus Aminicenantes bacterium]